MTLVYCLYINFLLKICSIEKNVVTLSENQRR